jgi:hypothetical protein
VTHSLDVALWSLLAAALVALTGLVVLDRGHPVARFGTLSSWAVYHPWWRAAVLLGWMWLGWHFFAR